MIFIPTRNNEKRKKKEIININAVTYHTIPPI